jgi:prepilin-type N-terminal cleavage/methylation domain-containing protein
MARRVPYPCPMRPTPITRRNGFTMLELIIVFVVFGLVAMISIRSVGDTLRRDKAAKAANILGSDIEQAFAAAARQRMPVMIALNRYNRTVSFVDRADTTKVYRRRSFRKTADYGVDTLYANRDTIVIMPNGIATNPMNITLQITSRGGVLYTKQVSISTGGMVRVNGR